MLKKRRSHDRLIFDMGIPIPEKDGFCIETGSRLSIAEKDVRMPWCFREFLCFTMTLYLALSMNMSWNVNSMQTSATKYCAIYYLDDQKRDLRSTTKCSTTKCLHFV